MPATRATPDAIALIRHDDTDTLLEIAQQLGKPACRAFWSDDMRANPTLAFAVVFCNPLNTVVGVRDAREPAKFAGVFAFTNIHAGWRATMMAARWGKYDVAAARAALLGVVLHDRLLYVDAFTTPDNRAARVGLSQHLGFAYRGPLALPLCYDGIEKPRLWYEYTAPGGAAAATIGA